MTTLERAEKVISDNAVADNLHGITYCELLNGKTAANYLWRDQNYRYACYLKWYTIQQATALIAAEAKQAAK